MSSPYHPPFNRHSFAKKLRESLDIHPRCRDALLPYFKKQDPEGFHHDLGAQDVLLDNLGIVCCEQLRRDRATKALTLVWRQLARYRQLRSLCLPESPYLGRHVHAKHRKGKAGEPRPFLRFLTELTIGLSDHAGALDLPWSDYFPGWLEEARRKLFFGLNLGDELADDRNSLRLDPWDQVETPDTGVLLPGGATICSDPVVLDPATATPDLPPRVEPTQKEIGSALRDQRDRPCCVSHALASALDIAARRARRGWRGRFSAMWIHGCSGQEWSSDRSLEHAVGLLRRRLPPEEREYPDEKFGGPNPLPMEFATARAAEQNLGLPEVLVLPVHDIARTKALLAMGWVVVAATRESADSLWGSAVYRLGLLASPLPSDQLDRGHAWCLVGYDHVDGSERWKYQGRFLALNSWGKRFAYESPYGRGVGSFPFSHLVNHGIHAFGIRFRPRG